MPFPPKPFIMVMTVEEATAFELDKNAELIIRLRYWDDQAKETNVSIDNLDYLKGIALNHLLNKN